MADKTTEQHAQAEPKEVQTGFYTFLALMGIAFAGIVVYMLYLFLS